ncbi:hypothetical protein Pan241w_58280 [Gimesia alba]|uniref:Uncharacterized protein n=1 Tax=Gimesia alba TaxID=2527973 RepID=A0A517RP90_9PLAN|nr:hypothetical protein [Gimesia alba]QDT45701.1 hypothetical protein Pan241w_58280 [Gimesia alba]
MVKFNHTQHIEQLIWANHDGSRWNHDPLDPDRAARLSEELKQAVREDLNNRLGIGLHYAGDYTEREIAEIIDKSPSTVHRTIPMAMRLLRVYFLVTLIGEWLDKYGACLLSMQSAKTINWEHDGYFVTTQYHHSMRKRPGREQLLRLLKQQRRLLELAADLDATNFVPYVACWKEKQANRWCVDFPLYFKDRGAAIAFAKDNGVNFIFHIASSSIEIM